MYNISNTILRQVVFEIFPKPCERLAIDRGRWRNRDRENKDTMIITRVLATRLWCSLLMR